MSPENIHLPSIIQTLHKEVGTADFAVQISEGTDLFPVTDRAFWSPNQIMPSFFEKTYLDPENIF